MNEMECTHCGKVQESFRGNYHYLESGLDNVIICDVEMIECDCGEKSALIPRIIALHEAIADCLLGQETYLSGKEIRFLRKNLGLKGNVFANLVGVDHATLSRWENDKSKPSARADRLIRFLYASKKRPEKAEEIASLTFKKYSSKQPKPPLHVLADTQKQYSCVRECR
jgi:putative zinc finger/helix-turn-helix YgiT family protein